MDDGARNLEESLAMLRHEVKQGVAAVILTPHQKPNRRSITAASALERTQKLQQAAKENGIDIRLYSGGEIFCCMDTIELLKQGKAGTLAGSDYILTEFSPDEEWAYIRNCLYDLLCEGYRPIVAHTERYRNVVKDFNRVEELKDMGCRIQINAGELPGLLGGQLKRTARSPDQRRACRSYRNGRPQSRGRPVCIDGGRSLMAAKTLQPGICGTSAL